MSVNDVEINCKYLIRDGRCTMLAFAERSSLTRTFVCCSGESSDRGYPISSRLMTR